MHIPRTAFLSRTCLKGTPLFISICLMACIPASASEMLQASLEYTAGPQVEEFKLEIQKCKDLPCEVKLLLERIFRVARNDQLRTKVWRRMLQEELNYYNGATVRKIETIAALYDMPLR